MKRRLALHALAAAAASGLAVPAARAGYNVWTGEYTVSRAEIEAALAPRFPARLRYAEMFQVTLSEPQLTLQPDTDRIGIGAVLQVVQPMLLREPLVGTLAASSGLRFDAARRAVLLHEPAADRLSLPGLHRDDARVLQSVGTHVARELLRDWPAYTFTDEQLRFGGRALAVGAIRVRPEGLAVEVR